MQYKSDFSSYFFPNNQKLILSVRPADKIKKRLSINEKEIHRFKLYVYDATSEWCEGMAVEVSITAKYASCFQAVYYEEQTIGYIHV
jgi:hypothetical protein